MVVTLVLADKVATRCLSESIKAGSWGDELPTEV